MNKIKTTMKASYIQIRPYLLIFLVLIVTSVVSQIIVNISLKENTIVSIGNMLTAFLLVMAIVLPISFFNKMIMLGATRKEYYISVLSVYLIWVTGFSVLNIIWLQLENSLLMENVIFFNMLEIFHWDQFNFVGMFIYQFGVYMMIISFINLLFSGLKHFVNWTIWIVLILAIPIVVSISSYRAQLVDALKVLLFNDSLLQGFGLTFIFSCMFLTFGWFFIRKRTI